MGDWWSQRSRNQQRNKRREWKKGEEKALLQEVWTQVMREKRMDLKKFVSVCACLPAQQQTHYYSNCLRRTKTAKLGLNVWLPVQICMYASRVLLPSLAHKHTTTSFFKALTADTTAADRILKSPTETCTNPFRNLCLCVFSLLHLQG